MTVSPSEKSTPSTEKRNRRGPRIRKSLTFSFYNRKPSFGIKTSLDLKSYVDVNTSEVTSEFLDFYLPDITTEELNNLKNR